MCRGSMALRWFQYARDWLPGRATWTFFPNTWTSFFVFLVPTLVIESWKYTFPFAKQYIFWDANFDLKKVGKVRATIIVRLWTRSIMENRNAVSAAAVSSKLVSVIVSSYGKVSQSSGLPAPLSQISCIYIKESAHVWATKTRKEIEKCFRCREGASASRPGSSQSNGSPSSGSAITPR